MVKNKRSIVIDIFFLKKYFLNGELNPYPPANSRGVLTTMPLRIASYSSPKKVDVHIMDEIFKKGKRTELRSRVVVKMQESISLSALNQKKMFIFHPKCSC